MTVTPSPRWDLLAEVVHARRANLGLTMRAIAEAGGPSDALLSRIESGHWAPTRGVTSSLTKLDTALQWQPGSAAQVLAGHPPRELLPPPPRLSEPGHPLTAIENELDTIRIIAEALDRLPNDGQQRVLSWAHSRYHRLLAPERNDTDQDER